MMIRGRRPRRVSEVGLYLEAQLEKSRREREDERVRMGVISDLLRGEMLLFDKRVTVTWPDGLPAYMTEEAVISFLDRAAGRDGS